MNSTQTDLGVFGYKFSEQEDAIAIGFDILAISSFLVYLLMYICTYSYLNNVSLAKECILVYLYKDIFSSMLLWRTLWAIEVILSYWNNHSTSEIQAMVLSFGLWFAGFYLASIAIFINIYNLKMAKTNTIDPIMPWLGEDERSAIKQIRCACCLVVMSFLVVTFGMGLYPKIFYIIVGDFKADIFISNSLYRGTLFLLLLINGGLVLAKRLYKTTLEVTVDKSIKKYTLSVMIVLCVTLLVLTGVELTRFANIKTSWELYQILLTPLHICAPFILIWRSDQLKIHSIRYLKNKYDDVFILSIYIVPTILFILINSILFILF